MLKEKMEQALEDLKAGKLILVVDDEDRENEGDLIGAAELSTTETMNFMAAEAKGLICVPMSREVAERLSLEQMVTNNTDNHETAFTVAVDHIETGTGISAVERSFTARKLADPQSKPQEFRRPGHIFPLVSKEGGVLERDGHTEATVDLMKLAGLQPVGLCVEIMAEDGTMMRGEALNEFAEKWELAKISVKDIQDYRKTYDNLIEEVNICRMPTRFGDFVSHTFVHAITGEHHVALVYGDVENAEDVLIRVHSECLTGEVFGSMRCDCGEQFDEAMKNIAEKGSGVLLYMRQEGRGIGLVNKMKAYKLQDEGLDTLDANLALGFGGDEREYYFASQMLGQLNVKSVQLMTNNPDKVQQLEEFGTVVSGISAHQMDAQEHDHFYLVTKKERMGHVLNI